MGATVTSVERGNANRAQGARRREAPEPAVRREGPASWGYLVHPSLLPTVFAPGGPPQERETEEEAAARKV